MLRTLQHIKRINLIVTILTKTDKNLINKHKEVFACNGYVQYLSYSNGIMDAYVQARIYEMCTIFCVTDTLK